MKQYLRFAKRFRLLFTPLVATSVLFTSPCQAATFAFSDGELSLTDFNGILSTEFNSRNHGETEGLAMGKNSFVSLENYLTVETSNSPLRAFTDVASTVSGEGINYTGLVQSDSEIVANFDIDAGKTLSFNFSSFLNLGTQIDASPVENAQAKGDIAFYLFDTSDIPEETLSDLLIDLLDNPDSIKKTPLSFFHLGGNINTLGNDYLNYQNSSDITLTENYKKTDVEGNEEHTLVEYEGFFQRYFEKQANLTLIVTRRSQARVTAPEPSTSLALLLFLGLLAIVHKGRSRAKKLKDSSGIIVVKL
ncbi:hypothetical protein DP115_15480 [Brasilonema octagenarum UFV-OR1]|uniref:PEP-CTERM sorting domain-containing protein n=1 Tax=Brasilonema octagenarum UFV-OR1 TaxID=417115 RepID=A0ABX1MAH6_9CYAN|nr:hypothetical protein [Brasilonema octagenarum UFV-OR1]